MNHFSTFLLYMMHVLRDYFCAATFVMPITFWFLHRHWVWLSELYLTVYVAILLLREGLGTTLGVDASVMVLGVGSIGEGPRSCDSIKKISCLATVMGCLFCVYYFFLFFISNIIYIYFQFFLTLN